MSENAFIVAARTGQNDFWRYFATVLLVIFLVLTAGICLLLPVVMQTGGNLKQIPGYWLLAINLLTFLFISIGVWIGLRFLHHRPFFTIVNPAGRLNWKRFWAGAGSWFLLAAAGDLVLSLFQPGNYTWKFDAGAFWPYLVVAVLLIPVQASAEEFLFRGYLTQGFGLINVWVGWLIPSVLFGLLHSANPEVGAYGMLLTMPAYIGMGLLLGWMTLRSQSLEIALGIHIANNLYSSLVVTFPSSALETQSLFAIKHYDALMALGVFVVSALVFVLIFEFAGRALWRKPALLLLILPVLLLAACGPTQATETTQATQEQQAPAGQETPAPQEALPTQTSQATSGEVPSGQEGYPAAGQETPVEQLVPTEPGGYPAPETPVEETPVQAPSPQETATAEAPEAETPSGEETSAVTETAPTEQETSSAAETPSAQGTASGEETATVETRPTPTLGAPLVRTLPLEDCMLEGTQIEAQCGTLEVPENRADPEGRRITLRVVVLPATRRNPQPDPVFLLAGGPGQAASESFTFLLGALERIRFQRDLVMVDQRGTGESNPLKCKEPEPEPSETPEAIQADIPEEEQLAEIEACLEGFQESNLTQYTTDVAMQDLDAVRHALGYERVNLLGVSYGTRAALAYQNLYPNRVRTMVLDGVAPLGWGLGTTMRADAQRALDLIFQRCEQETACREKFPNLNREFVDLLSALDRNSEEVFVSDPVTAEPLEVIVTPLMLSSTVRLMSYNDIQTALIPLMIHQAAQGNFTMLASQYLMVLGSLSDSLSIGMYYSVWCYEDLPILPAGGELGPYYFDPNMELSRQVCERWPAIDRPVDIPVSSNNQVPVLIISGEMDPVTPPANGEVVAGIYPNSEHLILPGLGHNNFYVGCMPNVIFDFFETGTEEGLKTDCLQNITPMPFFLSPVGPVPFPVP